MKYYILFIITILSSTAIVPSSHKTNKTPKERRKGPPTNTVAPATITQQEEQKIEDPTTPPSLQILDEKAPTVQGPEKKSSNIARILEHTYAEQQNTPSTTANAETSTDKTENQELEISSDTEDDTHDGELEEWIFANLTDLDKKQDIDGQSIPATTPTTTEKLLQLFLQWKKTNIDDYFLIEKCSTTLRVVTCYSVLVGIIKDKKFGGFIEHFDSEADGGGIRWLDEAIRQAVKDKKESALRTILNAAKEEFFLSKLSPETRTIASNFFVQMARSKHQACTAELEETLKDLADLSGIISSTKSDSGPHPKSRTEQELRDFAEKIAGLITGFASDDTLTLSPTTTKK